MRELDFVFTLLNGEPRYEPISYTSKPVTLSVNFIFYINCKNLASSGGPFKSMWPAAGLLDSTALNYLYFQDIFVKLIG